MKKTLTINLGGFVYHIDEDAYRLLDNYLVNLRLHFRREAGADEIVCDMEQRIAELFSERLGESRQVVTLQDVEAVIAQMGQPEDLSGEGDASNRQEDFSGESPRTGTDYASQEIRLHKLYRDPDDKVLGGVASGLAAYMGWDVTWVRLFFLLLLLLFKGTVFIYVVGWIIIPLARTATEKLAMRGTPINVENIGKTVTDGFERVNQGFEQVNAYVRSDQPRSLLRRLLEGVVAVAGFLLKLLLVFLAICLSPVLFVLLIVCFALLMAGLGVIAALPAFFYQFFPMVDWAALGTTPGVLVSLALAGILLLGIPVVGLIHLLMRQFGGWQPMSGTVRVVFLLLWLAALSVAIFWIVTEPNIASMITFNL